MCLGEVVTAPGVGSLTLTFPASLNPPFLVAGPNGQSRSDHAHGKAERLRIQERSHTEAGVGEQPRWGTADTGPREWRLSRTAPAGRALPGLSRPDRGRGHAATQQVAPSPCHTTPRRASGGGQGGARSTSAPVNGPSATPLPPGGPEQAIADQPSSNRGHSHGASQKVAPSLHHTTAQRGHGTIKHQLTADRLCSRDEVGPSSSTRFSAPTAWRSG
jgi:hypothetical protein